MSDTVKAWIEERRGIHRNRHVKRSAWSEATRDWAVEFPHALTALEQVLELHEPINGFVGDPSHWECNVCGDDRGPKPYPCPTVQAIEGAINE